MPVTNYGYRHFFWWRRGESNYIRRVKYCKIRINIEEKMTSKCQFCNIS